MFCLQDTRVSFACKQALTFVLRPASRRVNTEKSKTVENKTEDTKNDDKVGGARQAETTASNAEEGEQSTESREQSGESVEQSAEAGERGAESGEGAAASLVRGPMIADPSELVCMH